MREVTIRAFAKLTLSLHITGTRADGYHELDATMVSIDEPHDDLVIRPAARTSLSCPRARIRASGRGGSARVARTRCIWGGRCSRRKVRLP